MKRSGMTTAVAAYVLLVAVAALAAQPAQQQQQAVRIPAAPVEEVAAEPAAPIEAPTAEPEAGQSRIQLAILLDTSGSMSGLINQAREQLWQIVNSFAITKKNGKPPLLEVALYEYGHSPLGAECGYIRQCVPLTVDLDLVSDQLFKLHTNGGEEYCGQVIQRCVDELKWSDSNDDLKVIVIAGNEPFTQGTVDYHKSCKAAIERGVIVNTIHCGPEQIGIDTGWQDGALLADGAYSFIDQNQAVVRIPAPQDEELARLSTELNETYIPYGERGEAGLANQALQDANAAGMSAGSNASRAYSKASVHYKASSWDLVDAITDGDVKLEDVKDEDMPENMRGMTEEERKAYIKEQTERRAEIQEKIRELSKARDAYVAAERKKQAEAEGGETFDSALLEALDTQAADAGFE